MKISFTALLTTVATLGAMAVVQPASAAVNLSINSASYTYASFDNSGSSVANNVMSLGGDGVSNNDIMFWTATTTFTLPATGTPVLSITDLAADDSVVVELNGTAIASAGLFGPGAGSFIFNPAGSAVAWNFLGNGPQSISVTSPFNVGANTLELIVNNNNDGIFGTSLTKGPSSLAFTASISVVPELSTWSLMLIGLAGLGYAGHRSRKSAAFAA